MDRWLYALRWIFIVFLLAVAVIDIRRRQIKPCLVYTMFGLGAVRILLEIIISGMYLTSLWAALITCGITTLVFWGMYRLTHGIGLGDVKLMSACAFFYSIRAIPTIVILAMLFVSAVGIIMVIRDRHNLKAQLPFAPFVAVAAILRELLVLMEAL